MAGDSMNRIRVRHLTGQLCPACHPARQPLFAGYNTFYGRTLAPELVDRAWREFETGERMHALGARLDGELVGIVHFFTHPSTTSADVCYLQDLFTDSKARGRGVGRTRRLYDQVALDKGFMQYQIPL